jgi:alpha-1,2-mannosyltransferase
VLVYTGLVSISRILALYNYYHTPFSVLFQLETVELPQVLNVTGLLPPPPPRGSTNDDDLPPIDLAPIADFGLRLCVGKEWHRFPGSFHVPKGVEVRFIQSEFAGLVPGRFPERAPRASFLDRVEGTRVVPMNQNDLNRAQPSHYVSG